MSETKNINWDEIKEDYILRNSAKTTKALLLKDLAKKYQVPYEDLQNRVLKEQWHKLMKPDNQELNTGVAPESPNKQAFTEIEVRRKNFQSATICLDKGLQKLSQIKCEEITPELAIKMVQLGLKGRHEAAGLPGKFNVNTDLNINHDVNEDFVEENINHQKKYKQLALKFVNFFEQEGLSEATNVKSKPNN